jgi:hypothetical protein
MKSGILLLLLSTFFLAACNKDKNHDSVCEKKVQIDKTLYINTKTDNYTIVDAKLSGNCLEIQFGSSGCDGKSWTVELVDAQGVVDTNPQQRYLKLALANNELCAAAFSKTVSFDITPLRIPGAKVVRLKLEGLNIALLYYY